MESGNALILIDLKELLETNLLKCFPASYFWSTILHLLPVWLEGRSTATRKINLMPKHNQEFVKHIPEALFYSCVARVSWASPTLDGEPHCDSTVRWMVPVLGQYLKMQNQNESVPLSTIKPCSEDRFSCSDSLEECRDCWLKDS